MSNFELEIKNLLNHLIYNENNETKQLAKNLIVDKFLSINKAFERRQEEIYDLIDQIKNMKNCFNCKHCDRGYGSCRLVNDLIGFGENCNKWEMK